MVWEELYRWLKAMVKNIVIRRILLDEQGNRKRKIIEIRPPICDYGLPDGQIVWERRK